MDKFIKGIGNTLYCLLRLSRKIGIVFGVIAGILAMILIVWTLIPDKDQYTEVHDGTIVEYMPATKRNDSGSKLTIKLDDDNTVLLDKRDADMVYNFNGTLHYECIYRTKVSGKHTVQIKRVYDDTGNIIATGSWESYID